MVWYKLKDSVEVYSKLSSSRWERPGCKTSSPSRAFDMSPAAIRALPLSRYSWTRWGIPGFAACRQLKTPFSTIWWENGLSGTPNIDCENPHNRHGLKAATKDTLCKPQEVHGMDEDLSLLLVGQTLGGIADAGVEDAWVDDVEAGDGNVGKNSRIRALYVPRGLMVRMGVRVLGRARVHGRRRRGGIGEGRVA